MNPGLILMSKLAAMMLMVIVGYGAVKFHVVESDDSKTLSRLIVYILQPCLICRAFPVRSGWASVHTRFGSYHWKY